MNRWQTVLAVALVGAGCNRGLTPTASVEAFLDAVAAHDSVEVVRFIDVKRVSESAVDPLIEMAGRMAENDPDAFGGFVPGGMAAEMLEQFRPMIAPLIEQLFWQSLLDPEALRRGPLASALGDRQLRFDEMADAYRGVAYEREREDGSVVVGVELAGEDEEGPRVTLPLVMEQVEDHWRVVAFEDLAEAFGGLTDSPGS